MVHQLAGRGPSKNALWSVIALILVIVTITSFGIRYSESAQDPTAVPAESVGEVEPKSDATTTALQKEKLQREVDDLRYKDNHPIRSWLRQNGVVVLTILALFGGWWRWLGEQRIARHRSDEERFQRVSDRLDSEQSATRLNAAINLRTFLQPGYENFYAQVFSLSLAHLRLRPDPSNLSAGRSLAEPASPLTQALVVAFAQSFSIARNHIEMVRVRRKRRWRSAVRRLSTFSSATTDVATIATGYDALEVGCLHLSSVNLAGVELQQINMQSSSFTIAGLTGVDFRGATLERVSFARCNLADARFDGANLSNVSFHNTALDESVFTGAQLNGTTFRMSSMQASNPEEAKSLMGTQFSNVIGLTDEQRRSCVAKGASFENGLETLWLTVREWHELNAHLLGTSQYDLARIVQDILADWEHIEVPGPNELCNAPLTSTAINVKALESMLDEARRNSPFDQD